MSLFKCKCCGADLRVKEGDRIVTCVYCGSTQTIPDSQDVNILSVYARGNLLRSQGEFEKAYATFAKLLDGETEDAETHWNLLLCKYGITYVDDYDGNKKPTINRMSMSSILDDEEYKKTLSLADFVSKEQYEEEASKIADIQDSILQIVQKENPYDIFISYKETDEFNSRTEDSVLAQEIYDKLTDEGYRVFFSRVSLSSIVGHEYEPYIYSALYTAKAMILVACNTDYVDAVWVKNEWQRYLFMMQKEKNKVLIPCYKGVDPYDLPKELRRLQGIDASKLGWMQDLSIGLKKVIKKEKEIVREKTVIASGSLDEMAGQMVRRGFDFLKRGNVEQAKKLFEESLSYADKALAHMGLLCIELGKRDLAGLASLHKDIADEPHYAMALKLASDEEKKEIENLRASILENIASDKAAIEKEKKEKYDRAISFKNDGNYQEASKRFSELFGFLDATAQYDECQKLKIEEDKRKAAEKEKKEKEEQLASYYSKVMHINGCNTATIKELEKAISMARVLEAENYASGIADYIISFSKRLSAKKRIKKIEVIFCVVAVSLAVFVPVMTVCVFVPLGRQNEIIAAIEDKQYNKADKLLEANGDFGESKKLKKMASAGRFLKVSDYSNALHELSSIGGNYTIGLDYRGGTGDDTALLDKNYVVTNNAVMNGYSLGDWMVRDYSLDARNYSISMTLYATYQANTYTITYNLDGGTNNPSNPSKYTTGQKTVILSEPTRDGYTFAGWSDGFKIFSTIDKDSYGDLYLTALWSAITYSISYDLDGGTFINEPTIYTIEDSVALPTPHKKGYTFLGWTGSNGIEPQIGYVQHVGTLGDKFYKANWEAIVYTISYNLCGGTLTQSVDGYTIEKDVVLPQPTRDGYEFIGWTGSNGNTPETNVVIPSGTIGDFQYTAHWELIVYSITYDLAGGTITSENPTSYTVETETFTLYEPERLGYTFTGWTGHRLNCSGNYDKVYEGTYGDIAFVAQWAPIKYSITYSLGGGANSSSNPKNYTIEDEVILENPTKEGYTFEGWFSDETCSTDKFDGIQSGSTGDVNVYAKWKANKNVLSVTSEDESRGEVSITSGSGYSGEPITVVASPTGDYVFKGWYNGNIKVSGREAYTFTMPTSDYSLVARFCTKDEMEVQERRTHGLVPTIDVENETVTYGLYPQTLINDSETISALDSLTSPDANGWYFLNDGYYAKKIASPYKNNYVFSGGTKIVSGATYWFKCEPIEWKILSSDNGKYSLVSAIVLDAHRYDDSSNNYKNSEIREWLNGAFYDTVFGLDGSLIQEVVVDNSASTTDSSTNYYACNNTTDRVYLLSYQDYSNKNYFADSASRCCKVTDWAKANGAYYSTLTSYKDEGFYWTRSPNSYGSDYAWCVGSGGYLDYHSVSLSDYCVRPSLQLKVS